MRIYAVFVSNQMTTVHKSMNFFQVRYLITFHKFNTDFLFLQQLTWNPGYNPSIRCYSPGYRTIYTPPLPNGTALLKHRACRATSTNRISFLSPFLQFPSSFFLLLLSFLVLLMKQKQYIKTLNVGWGCTSLDA